MAQCSTKRYRRLTCMRRHRQAMVAKVINRPIVDDECMLAMNEINLSSDTHDDQHEAACIEAIGNPKFL